MHGFHEFQILFLFCFSEQLYGFRIKVFTNDSCTLNINCNADGNTIEPITTLFKPSNMIDPNGQLDENYLINRQGEVFSRLGSPRCRLNFNAPC